MLGQPALLAGVGVVGDHEVAPGERRLDVDLGGGGRLAGGVHRLARTQQRLGRDARPVRALAADQLALDDGDAQAALGQRAGAVLARRAAAEHDHVVVAGHVGSSSPARSRTMYARVPVRPVRVGLAGALLVLAVRCGSAPQRVGEIARGRVRRPGRVHAPGKPGRDLLQQPAVAVRVAERRERAVAAVIGRTARSTRPGAAAPPNRQANPVAQWKTSLTSTPLLGQLVARGVDVGDDQIGGLEPTPARPT